MSLRKQQQKKKKGAKDTAAVKGATTTTTTTTTTAIVMQRTGSGKAYKRKKVRKGSEDGGHGIPQYQYDGPRDDVVIYGNYVALLPFAEKFVSVRADWMQDGENRLNPKKAAPTYQEEYEQWKLWKQQPNRKMFMVADVEMLADVGSRPNECLIGEAFLVVEQGSSPLTGNLEFLITEKSVRRRSLLSEALLLVLQYGSRTLGIEKFVVYPGTGNNRLLFQLREQSEKSKTVQKKRPHQHQHQHQHKQSSRRTSIVHEEQKMPKRTTRSSFSITEGLKKNLTRNPLKTRHRADIVARLTEHLNYRTEGDFWPKALDFHITKNERLILEMTTKTDEILEAVTCHASFLKYGAMLPDGHLRLPLITRINASALTLIPYLPEHVQRVHDLLKDFDLYGNLGNASMRTLAQEKLTQERLMGSPDVYSFCICAQEKPGDDQYPLHPIGRALVTCGVQSCYVYLAIGLTEERLAMKCYAEAIISLLHFVKNCLFCWKCQFPSGIPSILEKNQALANLLKMTQEEETEFIDLKGDSFRTALANLSSKVDIACFDDRDAKYADMPSPPEVVTSAVSGTTTTTTTSTSPTSAMATQRTAQEQGQTHAQDANVSPQNAVDLASEEKPTLATVSSASTSSSSLVKSTTSLPKTSVGSRRQTFNISSARY